ncbi:MAG: UbiD family decarboxylase [Pelovirga sp.]
MAFRAYLRDLMINRELKRVRTLVDSDLEIAALCRREFMADDSGSALLFEAVKGTTVQVAANLFGTRARLLQMLVDNEQELLEKIRALIHSGTQTAAVNLTNACNKTAESFAVPEYQQRELGLKDLPALRSWPDEKDPYLTLALTHTASPVDGSCNLGLYRAAIVDDQAIALNFATGSGAAYHLQQAEERAEALPVALIIGPDPALFWAAAAPLPSGCSEYAFAAAISDRPVALAPCSTQPLSVPATAEIIIEGEIRPAERISEGPFGNHSGQYVKRDDCPLMKVTAVRHRQQPIMPVTVVGPPPSENIQLAKLNELLLREMLCYDFPLVADIAMPGMTIFHGVAIIAVRACAAAEVAELIRQLTTKTMLNRARLLVLMDDDINIHDFNMTWWRAVNLLSSERITTVGTGLIINATGINRDRLVAEDRATTSLLDHRHYEITRTNSGCL